MSFVQAVTAWASNSPSASGSFTPSAGNALLVFTLDTASNGRTLTFTGTGTYTRLNGPDNFSDANGNTLAEGYQLSCSGGSQTVTATGTAGDGMGSYAFEYSNVTSIDNGAAVSRVTPGTGVGAILGTSVTVAVGDTLLAWCQDVQGTGSAITSPSGTNRGSGVNVTNYCFTEYDGTGGSIQPSFTSASGATDNHDVLQMVLHSGAIVLNLIDPAMVFFG